MRGTNPTQDDLDAAPAAGPQARTAGSLYAGPHSFSLEFMERLFEDFRRNPAELSEDWRSYFERLSRDNGALNANGNGHGYRPSFRPRSVFNPAPPAPAPAAARPSAAPEPAGEHDSFAALQERVDLLVRNHRVRGHILAQVDPLGRPSPQVPELELSFYGMSEADLDREFSTLSLGGANRKPLRQILQILRNTYCRSIGVQFMHIDDLQIRQWLQGRMERTENHLKLELAEQRRILKRLTDAVIFEQFLQAKYIGAKTFSLEGAETLIPLLDMAIERAGEHGVEQIVIGMAHRGRLNVLANIIGKHPRLIFREFEDVTPHLHTGAGDVKYHLGYSGDWCCATGRNVHLSLCYNPSHLEFINTVALGRTRAKQDRRGDADRERCLTLLIHGDAAFAGEGVVQETLNLSAVEGYQTGGALHVVVNNQIGFTTNPHEGRSTVYATDVARMLQIPIFHVNGEDPEAVGQVVRLAMDFRRTFKRDVVIDMYCYRLLGHNEGDEPSFTQPLMYAAIEKRKSVRDSYRDHLLDLGGLTRAEADQIAEERRAHLEQELEVARGDQFVPRQPSLDGIWVGYEGGPFAKAEAADTAVPREQLSDLLGRLTELPEDFHPHRKIERSLEARRKMAQGELPLDWATAEALAFASLAAAGMRVRLSGQDVQRGTFSHRHAVLHDQKDGHTYTPLQHLGPGQAPVELCNSPLSEAGVLGFDYGYSQDYPEALVLWEAQFGDFVNAAQVIIDQFISSAEDKWGRLSGLVMLLPHGFEGQGPEHSSARLERFLTLAAEDNIQVVNPSTPAQYFHLLRRQVLRRWRKPLVVLTPKSLLRHPRVVSPLDELAKGEFEMVIPDRTRDAGAHTDRVLLCSGKIYYELLEKREELKRQDVAIVRLEQYYPLPVTQLQAALEGFADGTPVLWVQEEPENMGAWRYLHSDYCSSLFGRLPLSAVTRPESASPATGSTASHRLEQAELIHRAFGGPAPAGGVTSNC